MYVSGTVGSEASALGASFAPILRRRCDISDPREFTAPEPKSHAQRDKSAAPAATRASSGGATALKTKARETQGYNAQTALFAIWGPGKTAQTGDAPEAFDTQDGHDKARVASNKNVGGVATRGVRAVDEREAKVEGCRHPREPSKYGVEKTELASERSAWMDPTGAFNARGALANRPADNEATSLKGTAEGRIGAKGADLKLAGEGTFGKRPEDVLPEKPDERAPIADQNTKTGGVIGGIEGVGGKAEDLKFVGGAGYKSAKTAPEPGGKNELNTKEANGSVKIGNNGVEAVSGTLGAGTTSSAGVSTKGTATAAYDAKNKAFTGGFGWTTANAAGVGGGGGATATIGKDSAALTANANINLAGGRNVAGNVGLDQTFKVDGPTAVGDTWQVTVLDASGVVGGLGGGATNAASGAGLNAKIGGHDERSQVVTRTFKTREGAEAFRKKVDVANPEARKEAMGASDWDMAMGDGLGDMAMGDSVASQEGGGGNLGGGAKALGVDVGIMFGSSSSKGVATRRIDAKFIEVTVEGIDTDSKGGSLGNAVGGMNRTGIEQNRLKEIVQIDVTHKDHKRAWMLIQNGGIPALRLMSAAEEGKLWKYVRRVSGKRDTTDTSANIGVLNTSNQRIHDIEKSEDADGNVSETHRG